MISARNAFVLAACCWLTNACSPEENGVDGGAELSEAGVGAPDAAAGDAQSASKDAAEVSAADSGGSASTDAGGTFDGAAMLDDSGVPDSGMPDSGVRDPGTSGDGKITIRTYTTQPELTDKGAPKGRRFSFSMDSTKSTIFDGKDTTLVASKPRSLTREIVVYVPARYRDGTPAPLLVIQDGPPPPRPGQPPPQGTIDLISRALDNLTTSSDPARKLPAFIAIAVQNGGGDAQGSERGLEYDTLSDRYARFVQLEVLPAVLADPQIKAAYPNLKFTDDPEGKATYGCSSGGAAAFTMAWFRPDLFRRAITYSGTFVAQQNDGQPESAMYPLGAWDYHSGKKVIANTSPTKPIRAFLNVNSNDLNSRDAESTHHNWVMANQRMADELGAKGYHYRFVYAEGTGHCEGAVLSATLADTLVWTWAGYPTD